MRPPFSVLACRMANGTVAKLHTHRINGDEYRPLPLSPRQHAVIHAAQSVTALDGNGNANMTINRGKRR